MECSSQVKLTATAGVSDKHVLKLTGLTIPYNKMLPDAGKSNLSVYCKLYEEMTWDIKDYSEQVKRPCPCFDRCA